tara:strand:+ start:443 stop:1474 length:1032 start_codon:yes stop_codon:yes gene_type:complete
MISIKYNTLLNFTYRIFKKINLDEFSAKAVSFGICEASLRGVDSHGIKLFPHYVKSGILGRKNPKPKFKFYKKFDSAYLLDANDGFGLAAGAKAIKKGVDIAKKKGICIVGVKNSSHPGALASILLPAARKGFVALGFTHADSLQLTYGSKEAFFGTNPICFVAPRYKKEPFCLDMATTQISWNKLLNFKRLKKNLPSDSAADKKGKATNNPNLAQSLISIGAYKGYGLAAMIEIMCSVFLGMNFGKNIPPMYKSSMQKPRKLGQFYLVFKSDIFVNKDNFLKNLNKMYNQIKKQKKAKNKKIYMPNDKEILIAKKRLRSGIPVDQILYKEINEIGKKFKISI